MPLAMQKEKVPLSWVQSMLRVPLNVIGYWAPPGAVRRFEVGGPASLVARTLKWLALAKAEQVLVELAIGGECTRLTRLYCPGLDDIPAVVPTMLNSQVPPASPGQGCVAEMASPRAVPAQASMAAVAVAASRLAGMSDLLGRPGDNRGAAGDNRVKLGFQPCILAMSTH